MSVRTIEVILHGMLSSSIFTCTSWSIEDGCLLIFNEISKERSGFPLSSLLCFHVSAESSRTIEDTYRDMMK